MTDLNEPLTGGVKAETKRRGNGGAARKPASPSEAKLLEFAELLFFAYRDFTRDPDAILADF
ncbi:MAG TPA: MarR family transcriptional regulator, partial [Methyloceanibacter sp.]|nr:MarR family transcriptional regulator [Methyloceanibacter sp.]